MMQETQQSSDSEASRLEVKKIPLMEVFGPTIQGEGSVIGQQTYFLRFGLCDYKCTYCDSMHAVDPIQVHDNAMWLTQAEIYTKIAQQRAEAEHSTYWVTLSGGNPCVHDLSHLCSMLISNQWYIAVETQGTFCPDWLHKCDVVTVSPKLASMWEIDEFQYIDFLRKMRGHKGLAIKIVVFSKKDLDQAVHLFKLAHQYGIEWSQMYLSQGNPYPPHMKELWTSNDILWMKLRAQYLHLLPAIMEDKYLSQVKFLPQWHVWLWGNKQGV